jgi:hypothetical protein
MKGRWEFRFGCFPQTQTVLWLVQRLAQADAAATVIKDYASSLVPLSCFNSSCSEAQCAFHHG